MVQLDMKSVDRFEKMVNEEMVDEEMVRDIDMELEIENESLVEIEDIVHPIEKESQTNHDVCGKPFPTKYSLERHLSKEHVGTPDDFIFIVNSNVGTFAPFNINMRYDSKYLQF